MSDPQTVSAAVAALYNTYPFPPEPLLDEPPPGYNWRWNWSAAYNFCTGHKPDRQDIRILDAGCGTGVGTEYLVHLNPQAQVIGIDLSSGTLEVARERCRRSGADRAEFHNLSLYDVDQIPGEFDLINCVGVLHHLPDPIRGIKALSKKLAPGGIFHIFVYSELGRREIQLMQEAIALLQNDRSDYREGVAIGRQLFASLPENNRLVRREQERWSIENHRDECFADMYVHPQEIDYNIHTLFELIEASGLNFVGFSNPRQWDISRLIGQNAELVERAKRLSGSFGVAQTANRDLYRLIELLDPDSVTHYEFFLSRGELERSLWDSDETLLNAIPERSSCMEGWESRMLFNYDYQVIDLSEAEFRFMQACDANQTQQKSIKDILTEAPISLDQVRRLQAQQLIWLSSRR